MPLAFILVSLAIFGSWGVVAREIQLSAPILVWLMALSGLSFSWALTPQGSHLLPIPKGSVLVGANLAADLLLLITAFRGLPFAVAITLHYLGPLLVQLVAPVVLRERFSGYQFVLSFMGLIGGALVVSPELTELTTGKWWAVAAGLGSAFTLAGNIIFQKRHMQSAPSTTLAVAQYNFVLCITLLPIATGAILLGLVSRPLSSVDVLSCLAAGAVVQGIAMLMFNTAIKKIAASVVAVVTPFEIVFSSLFGVLVYGDVLNFVQLLGICLVMTAIFLVSMNGRRNAGH